MKDIHDVRRASLNWAKFNGLKYIAGGVNIAVHKLEAFATGDGNLTDNELSKLVDALTGGMMQWNASTQAIVKTNNPVSKPLCQAAPDFERTATEYKSGSTASVGTLKLVRGATLSADGVAGVSLSGPRKVA